MAKKFPSFEDDHRNFIAVQHIFFVATAASEGRVNLSPKGGDSIKVISDNRLIWRNITGSGNESAGHLLQSNRMTVMWCGFETRPLILRAYGTARAVHDGDADWAELDAHFAPHDGARQVFDMTVDLVQTSCGYQVPYFDFKDERPTMDQWTAGKGRDGIKAYWDETNRTTIDGAPTGIDPYL